MNDSDLCKWLRDNSSGIYRPSAEAADRIDRLNEQLLKIKDHAFNCCEFEMLSELEDRISAICGT